MNGINDKYAVYYTAKEYSEKQSVEKGHTDRHRRRCRQ